MEKNSIEKVLNLLALPLTAKFKYLQFNGLADGNLLIPNFDMNDLSGRYFILKGIKIIPEYPAGAAIYQDFYVTDGAIKNQELVVGNTRINRLFDVSAFGTNLNFLINESSIDIFPQYNAIVPPFVGGNVPLDLDVDNIFYKYPEKIVSLGVSVNSLIFNAIDGLGAQIQPNVKVFIQCYLL